MKRKNSTTTVEAAKTNRLIARFEDLMNLKAIIEHGSINAAARTIGYSQSALTRSVSRVEAALGVRLVDRSARGIVPTEYGQALVNHLRTIHRELQHTAATLDSLKDATQGEIACGGTIAPLSWLIPVAADHLQRIKPHLRLRVVEGVPMKLLSMLRLGEIDVAIAVKFDQEKEPDLIEEAVGSDQIGIFAKKDHRIFNQALPDLKTILASERWIMPGPGSNLQKIVSSSLAEWGMDVPKKAVHTSSSVVIRKLISDSDYLAITTSQAIAQDVKNGSVRVVQGDWQFPFTRTVIYLRANETISPAMLAFLHYIRSAASANPISPADRSQAKWLTVTRLVHNSVFANS